MSDQKTEDPAVDGPGEDAEAEMARYGITRVPIDIYHYKDYRYTNLADAIAQAKRSG
jgi:hypothetical protein